MNGQVCWLDDTFLYCGCLQQLNNRLLLDAYVALC
jgi:hypothetical protein